MWSNRMLVLGAAAVGAAAMLRIFIKNFFKLNLILCCKALLHWIH